MLTFIGIGAAIAHHWLLKDSNNKLVAVSRTEDALKDIQSNYGEDRVKIVVGDVSKKSTSEKAVKTAIESFGKLDSVIANAGVLDPVSQIVDADTDKWRKLYDINLFGVVDLVALALPHLRESKGNVVAVLSGASTTPYNGWSAYGSSKAALNHFILSIAAEEPDVKAISIAPGVVDTSMQLDIREILGKAMKPEALQKFVNLHQNKELLPPEVPASVLSNLAFKGWPDILDGQYLRYNDDVLKSYLG